MNFYNAQKQFNENAKLFGNSRSNPENYNKYHGLANLAKGLEHMQVELDEIKKLLAYIANKK